MESPFKAETVSSKRMAGIDEELQIKFKEELNFTKSKIFHFPKLKKQTYWATIQNTRSQSTLRFWSEIDQNIWRPALKIKSKTALDSLK